MVLCSGECTGMVRCSGVVVNALTWYGAVVNAVARHYSHSGSSFGQPDNFSYIGDCTELALVCGVLGCLGGEDRELQPHCSKSGKC